MRRVKPDLENHHDALLIAMTSVISGRAPEHRGKGLKFIIDAINDIGNTHLLIHTGNACLAGDTPIYVANLSDSVKVVKDNVFGTYAELFFEIS